MTVILDGRPLAFLAFQASAMLDGFPTEVAVCRCPDVEPSSVRIRPHAAWAGLDREADMEEISGLSPSVLEATGVDAAEACRRLEEWTEGHRVVVHHEAVSLPLLSRLHEAAGLPAPGGISGFYATLDEIIGVLGYDYEAMHGEFVLPYSGLRPHRAAYDAGLMAEAASRIAAGRPQRRRAM